MPDHRRSWWLREALAADPGEPCPPLAEPTRADVAIVGGGYTGMWTAYHLKRADPSADVVLLEADICGAGPSGRNGGFLYGLWEDFPVLEALFGTEDAIRIGRSADACVDLAEEIFRTAGMDIWLRRAGHLGVSTSPRFDAHLEAFLEPYRGVEGMPADVFVRLSPAEVAARCRSPRFRGGVLQPWGATVQPARLARGLRKLILGLGVRLHERTPVTTIEPGRVVRLSTPGGMVTADRLVLGLNAWSHQIREFRRAIVPRASHIVLTEPAPELLERIGWTGGEGLYDFRATLHYVRTTPDGRIAFGAGTGDAAGDIGERFADDPAWHRRLGEKLRWWFPEFRGVRIDAAWGGPIDVCGYHVPFLGSMWGGNVHYAMGFTGGGVGPCVLSGRILSSLALGRRDAYSSFPLVGYRPKRFPPEPVLSTAARVTLGAIVRTDDAWESGRRGNLLLREIARMPRRFGYHLGH
jgi:glycine/D-amino acid oxidase-like deaminating enzyme